jgi:hypothetical protein
MQRFKTFDGTGVAPNGRLYPVDLNTMQDLGAAQHDLSQVVGVGQLSIGEDPLALVRYGAGIARLIGGLRVDNLFTAGGIQPSNVTQAQRDSLAAGMAPKGTAIFNTDKNRWEFNSGNDGSRVWDVFGTNVSTGWIDASDESWAYVSYAAPTGIVNITGDKTTKYTIGMKVKLTQSAAIRYGIITAVGVYSGGVTPLTIYFGTDYSLLNATISSPAYSFGRAPFGFPPARGKWTIRIIDTSVNSRSSPVNGTWYNQGGKSITLPIGTWRLSFYADTEANQTGTPGSCDLYCALGLTTTTSTDKELIDGMTLGATQNVMRKLMKRSKEVVISNPTTYYLNIMVSQSGGTAGSVTVRGDDRTIVLEAECAYI